MIVGTLMPALTQTLSLPLARTPTLPPAPALAHVTSRHVVTRTKMART